MWVESVHDGRCIDGDDGTLNEGREKVEEHWHEHAHHWTAGQTVKTDSLLLLSIFFPFLYIIFFSFLLFKSCFLFSLSNFFIVINSYRVEKSFWKSPVLEDESLNRYLIRGLEQGQDTIVPEVLIRPLFKPFVEDELPDIIKGTLPFVAHPYTSEPCPYNIGRPVTLAVGPEGGFIQYEVEKLIECGFSTVHMGERTLHVESAISGLISKLM